MCYNRSMADVASRELRNHARAVLDRVDGGESVVITVDGRPVARLEPISSRPRWVPRATFARSILAHQADPGLSTDLDALGDETTDDLPFR